MRRGRTVRVKKKGRKLTRTDRENKGVTARGWKDRKGEVRAISNLSELYNEL